MALRIVRQDKIRNKLIFILGWLLLSCTSQPNKNSYILAERLFTDGKYSASVEEFKRVYENDPRGVIAEQALFRMGVIQFLYLEKYPDAIKSFRQFAALSKNKELVFQAEKNIAEIYFNKMESFASSVEQYHRLLEKFPESKESDHFRLRLGKSYYGALNFPKAIQEYQTLIKKYPKSTLLPEAMYLIGNTYYTKGDLEAAVQAFDDVLFIFPKSPQAVFAQFGIANCYEEMNRNEDALTIYTRIVSTHPSKKIIEAKIKRLKETVQK